MSPALNKPIGLAEFLEWGERTLPSAWCRSGIRRAGAHRKADIREIADTVQRKGFTLLAITAAHLRTLAELPIHHRDPFDHLLIAQAIADRATFISDDRNTPNYPVQFVACTDSPSRGQSPF